MCITVLFTLAYVCIYIILLDVPAAVESYASSWSLFTKASTESNEVPSSFKGNMQLCIYSAQNVAFDMLVITSSTCLTIRPWDCIK